MLRDRVEDTDPRSVHQSVRITTASMSRAEEIRGRQRRYLMSMSLRTVCFVGAWLSFLAGWNWAWPFLVAGALVLPYIAVVMANAAANLHDGFELGDVDYRRGELGSRDPRHEL